VAQAFIANPFNLPWINHKDRNKKNNHVSNLEWSTPSMNMNHALSTGPAIRIPKGESHYWAKLTAKVVRAARELFEDGVTITELANEYDVCFKTMNKAVHKMTWKHIA
jgi:hypothetical protein